MSGHGEIAREGTYASTGDARGGGARRAVATICATLLLVAAAAAVALAQETHDVAVIDDAYDPPTIEVTAGDTVEWTHTGSNPHTVTADDGSFDSHPECETFADSADGNCMEQGDTYAETFEAPGEYPYHCRIHGSPGAGMAGTVIVQAADGEPADDDEPADPVEEEDDPTDDSGPVEDEEADEELPHTGLPGILTLLAAAALGGGTLLRRAARRP